MSGDVPLDGTDAVRIRLPGGNKRALLIRLAAIGEALTGRGRDAVLAALTERERLGSTGLGAGVALPHGRVEGLTRVHGAFARLASPVDFEAVDGQPVDLVFMLLSPPDAGAEHLKALAAASRALRDRERVEKLRGARSRDAMLALLTGGDAGGGSGRA